MIDDPHAAADSYAVHARRTHPCLQPSFSARRKRPQACERAGAGGVSALRKLRTVPARSVGSLGPVRRLAEPVIGPLPSAASRRPVLHVFDPFVDIPSASSAIAIARKLHMRIGKPEIPLHTSNV